MSTITKPPFRADHVGSLLKPDELLAARASWKAGDITPNQLRDVEDRSIINAIKLQELAGLQSITDGEFRRGFWHVDFLIGFEGINWTHADYSISFKGEHGEKAETHSMLVVTDKVCRSQPIEIDDFNFLKERTHHTPKKCIPTPTILHMRGGRKVISEVAYPDIDEFWNDIIQGYHEEIQDLASVGCRYLQLDDVSFAFLCDESIREQIKRDGEDPERLPEKYAQIISAIAKGRGEDMTVMLHTCRGNHASMWMAEGGYDVIAETVFNAAEVDGFFLEYDTERAGGFEPLRFMPKGKKVVLGLISSKKPELESKDDLKRRIDEAAKYAAIEDLYLSPQCGFSSTEGGNQVTLDDQRKKLELVVEVAAEVWGEN